MTELKLIMRNKYGKVLYYPTCEQGTWLAKLLGVACFTMEKVEILKEKYQILVHDCLDKRPVVEWKELIC